MIIYPVAIIVILLVAFVVVWRRAYFVEKEGLIPSAPVGEQSQPINYSKEENEGEQSGEKKKFTIFKVTILTTKHRCITFLRPLVTEAEIG